MEKTIVMIDSGFLSKVSYQIGEGHYFKYDLLKFSKRLAGKLNLIFKQLYIYTAPPFQDKNPSSDEKRRKEEYDSFNQKLRQNEEIVIREGRCQRLCVDGKYTFKQKGVDTLLTMDLMNLLIEYPKIKTVILIACDTDFVPVVRYLKKSGIDVFLFTYFERDRKSKFSTSNELLKNVTRYFKLTREDFEDCKLI